MLMSSHHSHKLSLSDIGRMVNVAMNSIQLLSQMSITILSTAFIPRPDFVFLFFCSSSVVRALWSSG